MLLGAATPPLAEIIGTAAWAASGAGRAAVRANLRVIAPERATSATVRRVFVAQTRNYFEIFQIPRMAPERLIAAVEHRGWDHFLRAVEQGRGAIVASAHLGPVSLVGQLFVAHGYEVVLPVEATRSRFQQAVNRARGSMGLQIVSTDAPLAIFRALRERKVFGLLADRAVTGTGERVSFFGGEALLPSAHVVLGLRTGAPVLPAFSTREGGRLVATFEPPLELVSTGDRAADVRAGVAAWARVLERHIARTPDQWTVFERVWSADR